MFLKILNWFATQLKQRRKYLILIFKINKLWARIYYSVYAVHLYNYWNVFCSLFINFRRMKSGSWRLITAYFIPSLNIHFIENKQRIRWGGVVKVKCHNTRENWYFICHLQFSSSMESSKTKSTILTKHLVDIMWIFRHNHIFHYSLGRKTVLNLHK